MLADQLPGAFQQTGAASSFDDGRQETGRLRIQSLVHLEHRQRWSQTSAATQLPLMGTAGLLAQCAVHDTMTARCQPDHINITATRRDRRTCWGAYFHGSHYWNADQEGILGQAWR